jgi:hypothetical protein
MSRINSRSKWWIAAGCLACAMAFVVSKSLAQQPSPTQKRLAVPTAPLANRDVSANPIDMQQIEAWRKEYPYESVAGRLEYERPFRGAVQPALSKESESLLTKSETEPNDGMLRVVGSSRAYSLELLHSDKLDEFMKKDELGRGRFPLPGPVYLPVPPVKPVPFAEVSPLSAEYVLDKPLALPTSPKGGRQPFNNPWRLPPRQSLTDLNLRSQFGWWGFVPPITLGSIKSVDRVAGFNSHGFRQMPLAFENDPDNRWRIARLELVGLLKHAEPAVYVSEHLPQMEELASAKTRPLTSFESASLAKLRDGEELVVSARANQIEMLGAVRAAKQCLACHQVPRGMLLGAFSYQLQREPPIKAPLGDFTD